MVAPYNYHEDPSSSHHHSYYDQHHPHQMQPPPPSAPPPPPQPAPSRRAPKSKSSKAASNTNDTNANSSRSKKRRGRAPNTQRADSSAREATLKSLDHLGLSSAPLPPQQQHQFRRSAKSKKRSQQQNNNNNNNNNNQTISSVQQQHQPYNSYSYPHSHPQHQLPPQVPPHQQYHHYSSSSPHPSFQSSPYTTPYQQLHHQTPTPQSTKRKTDDDDTGAASSGDEYPGNLLETYIGQVGACVALGLGPKQVLTEVAWDNLKPEERENLLAYLPSSLPLRRRDTLVRRLLNGECLYFGSPRDRVFEDVAAGLTHPRVRRWRLRVSLIERRHHLLSLREFHNRGIRRLLARKACVSGDSTTSPMAGVAAVGGNLTKSGGALQALPNRIQATAEAAVQSGVNQEWDEERWRRVLDFRNQETRRYQMPERAFRYRNPWSDSIVGPLKRGPALDGGRPREHVLLRNERPSHVTILCIVRDAASRLFGNRGTRADICDLLRDSQYIREGATYQQLNTVVSGALDRLHYEESAPVKYDAETKEWVYLHNHLTEDDFERPAWARETAQRQLAAERTAGGGSRSGKKKRRKTKR